MMLACIALAVWLVLTGIQKNIKNRIAWGALTGLFTWMFFFLMDFWGEMLWFDSAGFAERFWTFKLNRYAFIVGGFIVGYFLVMLVGFSLRRTGKYLLRGAAVVGGLAVALWGNDNWDTYLKFLHSLETGVTDPIFNMDTGFYLFILPFLDSVNYILAVVMVIVLIASAAGIFTVTRSGEKIRIRDRDEDDASENNGGSRFRSLYLSAGLFLVVLAFMKFLDRYHLLFSDFGVVSGPGWTDINVKLPALNIIIGITLLAALMIFIPAARERAGKYSKALKSARIAGLVSIYGSVFVLWFLGLTIIPSLFQWLKVEPNELRLEEKYIEHNIHFTRMAFGLDKMEEEEFPVTGEFTETMFDNNQHVFNNVRLWDYRALDDVYKQFQEIRLYYEFSDVDVDRYHINGEYRQIMVSAREMEQRNLPRQSQTFINRRFKYTHGFGITLTNVSEFTENGLPDLLVKDIPPKSRYKTLEVEQPRLYYGELTREHVIANSGEDEFDYPKGEQNAYFRYDGEGGVPISNFWRKFLFGYKFDGTRLLFSGYPHKESRILFHRQIRERVMTVAPFLQLDDDPYITLIDGHLYWIVDAYTTSTWYPYSEPFSTREESRHLRYDQRRELMQEAGWQLHGKNYIRNSVKAFVNAYTGKVELYIFDEGDPIINVWSNIIPGVFKTRDEIPEGYMRHVRYPVDYLLAQGLVYAKYHMTDPTVFYNQEDLWIRATEKYYGYVQPVEPYYVMWEPPQTSDQEFILMMPFTPKNRQVAIGWIAGMCDMENYGRFLAYKFPKEKRILGPQQVETKIDQDRFLSGQLTLWDQRGSSVIRGNVLAIPVETTMIYVEPIYLKSETAAYPELRLVAVMHNDKLSYAETFDQAIRGLFTEIEPGLEAGAGEGVTESLDELIQKATRAFDRYISATGNKEFDNASRSLQELERTLNELNDEYRDNQ